MGNKTLPTGTEIQGKAGRYRIVRYLSIGGQAVLYVAACTKTAKQFALKLYHRSFDVGVMRKRSERLVKLKLIDVNPTLCGPVDTVSHDGTVGHVSPLINGTSLNDALPKMNFLASLQVAIGVAHAVEQANSVAKVSHGDLQANNCMVHQEGEIFHVRLIDFDNFTTPKDRTAPCLGQEWYMAPEVRTKRSTPNETSDRFSLSILIHEILLKKHIATGFDATPDEFHRTMMSGDWKHDPASTRTKRTGGYPAEILNTQMLGLFRRGVGTRPNDRPPAREWRDTLIQAISSIDVCSNCREANLIESCKRRCPHCITPYPTLKLSGSFGEMTLQDAAVELTRESLGGSDKVSKRHAVIRRDGPEYRLTDFSMNGTFRHGQSGWMKLPAEKSLLISAGDRIRFGDVECHVT